MEFLQDPLKNRNVKSLQPPPSKPLSQELLFPSNFRGKPNWKLLRDFLEREGKISKDDLIYIISSTNKILKNEGNVLYLQDPINVVGDIHGQFHDLIKILEIGGLPDDSKYLFIGDFVDRGQFSVEVITLLYTLKIYYPESIYLLRGNHECRQLTSFFNFQHECQLKYDQEVYEILMDSFDNLPIAALIDGKFFCVHGGISPELKKISDIERINRFQEPPRQGLFCDILWSDPMENQQIFTDLEFKGNEVRGCSYYFGEKAILPFLEQNNLICLIRAHEVQLEGFRMYRWTEEIKEFPPVLTIFSAPNYCDFYNNKGAILKFNNGVLNVQQFVYSQHPYLLPNFLNVFSWSIPFVSEKVTEMLYHMIKPDDNEDLENYESDEEHYKVFKKSKTMEEKKQEAQIVKNKIHFVSKMLMMQRTLREENENIVSIKGFSSDNKIPKGLLLQGKHAIRDALAIYNDAKKADQINEKMPLDPLQHQKEIHHLHANMNNNTLQID